jgi:nucleotide-binding universal stress UspA family protein
MTAKTLLLATDLSCRCDRALDRAAELAAEWRAKLVVLHVRQESGSDSDQPSWRRAPNAQQVAEERVRRDLRGRKGFDLEVIVKSGNPLTVTLETIQQVNCGLVVTGTARDEALGRILLGTLVSHLARKSEVPVLVVKSRPHGSYRNMVVATDYSENSRHALETALTLLPDVPASLFHACNALFEGRGRSDDWTPLIAEAKATGQEFLAGTPAAAQLGRSIPVICEPGEIGDLLEDLVSLQQVDLVVLGTAGRGGLANLLLGSTAQYLLERLPVDVLLVRAPKNPPTP